MFKGLKLNKILDLLIEVDYLIAIFFVPLTFAIFLPNANIFELNKMILFRFLLIFLIIFSYARFLLLKKNESKVVSAKFFRRYLWVPVGFLFLLALPLFSSVDLATSFWGLYDRQEGYFSCLGYFLWFSLIFWNLLVSFQADFEVFKTKIFKIIAAISIAGAISSLYGVLQILGIDFLNWSEPPALTGRTTSTLGQPNFLGSYLLFVLPLSFYLITTAKNKIWRWLCIFFTFLNLACLLFTSSRGAWVALFLGLVVLGISYLAKNRTAIFNKINWRYLVAVLLGIFLLFGTLMSYDNFLRQRVFGIFDFENGSVAARVYFWRASVDAISKEPVFGYGLENQEEILIKYYDKDWGVFGNVNARTNRAHNLILDILLTSGIIGLLAWVLLLTWATKLFWRTWKYSEHKNLALALYFGLATYILSLFFGFSFVVGNVYLYLFLALLAALDFASRSEGEFNKNRLPWPRFIYALLFLPLVFFGGRLVVSDFNALIQDHYFSSMQKALLDGQYFEAYTLYDYIKESQPGYFYYDVNFLKVAYSKIFDVNDLSVKDGAKKIATKILADNNSNNYASVQARALAHTILGDYSAAKIDFAALINRAPLLPENYVFEAKMLAVSGESEASLTAYDTALGLVPDDADARLNWDHLLNVKRYKAGIYLGKGNVYMTIKKYEAARANYKMALGYGFSLDLYKKIANTYYLEKNLDKAIWYNERASLINPSDYLWQYSLAVLYKEKGDKAKALRYATRAAELNSTDTGVTDLLNSLK
ncbi:MAG: O-antigen ligase family protein [Candidatus Falkowbacteria bacterium]